jgi:hypothetical protein
VSYRRPGRVNAARLFCLLVFLSVVFSSHAEEARRTVAHVGKTNITSRDIDYRIEIGRAYGNEGMTSEAALVSLVNDAIEREAARMYGIAVTNEELDALSEHADRNTKAPEILEKVKSAFGEDKPSYRKIYLAPKIMNKKLRNFFSRDPGVHASKRVLIEKAYTLVILGKTFEEAAEESGLEHSEFDIGGKVAATPPELKRYFPGDERPKDPLVELLETLSPGEVYGNIVEDDHSYKVVRLKEKDGDVYSVEAITARKRPFEEWLRREADKINVQITDPELEKSITSEYPTLWWVKSRLKSD